MSQEAFASIDAALDDHFSGQEPAPVAAPQSVDEAVNNLSGTEPAPAVPQPDGSQEAPAGEQAPAEAQSDEQPSDTAPEQPAEAGEAAPQDETTDVYVQDLPDDIDWSRKTKIKYGENDEREVTLEELRRQHMWQADYTRKTQELAQKRAVLEQEHANAAVERQRYVQGIEQIGQALAAQAPPEPDKSIEEIDPVAYLQQVTAKQAFDNRMQGLQREHQQALEQQAHEQRAQLDAYLKTSKEQLLLARPDLTDPSELRNFQDTNRAYMLKNGFTEDEAAQVTDYRAAIALDKARRYDEMRANANAKKAAPQQQTIQQSNVQAPPQGVTPSGVQEAGKRLDTEQTLDAAVDFLLAEQEARTAN